MDALSDHRSAARDGAASRGNPRRILLAGAALAACWAGPSAALTTFTDGVYAASNRADGNTIAAFRAGSDGTLVPLAEYATGGLGGTFDAGEGLDPLISEDSVLNVGNKFLLAVNAGSNTVSSLRINPDLSLDLVNTAPSGGVGPNSIAQSNGLVYVSNIESDGAFTGPPDQAGNITGLRLDPDTGELTPIAGSTRALGSRPSNVEFSTDGSHLVVSSWNGQSNQLPEGPDADELVSFGVRADGNLTAAATGNAASTQPGNAEGRNLPASIGFEIVEVGGEQIVIATEAREFLANGDPATLDKFQTASLSSWRIEDDGSLTPLSQDVLEGSSITEGPLGAGGPTSACWIVATPDGSTVYVANASGSAISSFHLNDDGSLTLIDNRAAQGIPADPSLDDPVANADGFIGLTLSADGDYLYQLLGLKGAIDVYGVGEGSSLSFLQRTSGLLPVGNVQGIVSVRAPGIAAVPLPATGLLLVSGLFGLGAAARRRSRG